MPQASKTILLGGRVFPSLYFLSDGKVHSDIRSHGVLSTPIDSRKGIGKADSFSAFPPFGSTKYHLYLLPLLSTVFDEFSLEVQRDSTRFQQNLDGRSKAFLWTFDGISVDSQ